MHIIINTTYIVKRKYAALATFKFVLGGTMGLNPTSMNYQISQNETKFLFLFELLDNIL